MQLKKLPQKLLLITWQYHRAIVHLLTLQHCQVLACLSYVKNVFQLHSMRTGKKVTQQNIHNMALSELEAAKSCFHKKIAWHSQINIKKVN
jgi:hypothetical protein